MLLDRKSQFLHKEEGTAGTAETLAAADGKILLKNGSQIEPQIEREPRDIARATLTPLGKVTGKKAGGLNLSWEANTPDTVTDDLPEEDLIKAASCALFMPESIAIGAVTGGPFVRGETVSGGTSSATGRVLIEAANGAAAVYIETLTGTFQSGETITLTLH
jgi:hypothetical protein